MASSDDMPTGFVVAFGAIALALMLAGTYINAKMEADAYNRVTGEHVTWYDAVWLDLRVQASPKRETNHE